MKVLKKNDCCTVYRASCMTWKKGAHLAFRESEPKATILKHPSSHSLRNMYSNILIWKMRYEINGKPHTFSSTVVLITMQFSDAEQVKQIKVIFRCGASQTDKDIEAWDWESENWTCSKLYCSWLVTNWQYVNITSSNWTLSIIEWSTFVKNWMANIPATFFVQMLLIRK